MPALFGDLAQVKLWARCAQGAVLTLEVQSVAEYEIAGEVLARTAAPGPFSSPQEVAFERPGAMSPGLPYALVLSAQGECSTDTTPESDDSGPYFRVARPDAPAWTRDRRDMPFETYVRLHEL